MKRKKVRCWEADVRCPEGEVQVVWFTVPDFGDAPRLYTCHNCGAIFAVDADEEFYKKRNFEQEKTSILCPECNETLASALPYPQNFRCQKTGQFRSYVVPKEIPHDYDAYVREFWNPLT